MKLAALVLLIPVLSAAQKWVPQTSGVTAGLRGVHAVSVWIVWASGADGTWLRTLDAGEHWESGKISGGESLDFRAIHGFSATEAIALSIGEGPSSNIFATSDGGKTWRVLFRNHDAKGFFDGLAFRDRKHGVAMGDPVDGHFAVFVTDDSGEHWMRRQGPAAQPGESSFAASNSTVVWNGAGIWLASGGVGGSRIFHSRNSGKTWRAIQTPVRHDKTTAGIFSLGWQDRKTAIAVGGDYRSDRESAANIAVTADGGQSWQPTNGPAGFRSAVAWLNQWKLWVAVGTSGSDWSTDGRTWTTFDSASYNAISGGWAVGPKGVIAKFAR